MSHISGKKIAKSHSTVIKAAEPVIRAALKLEEVSKIITGEIATIRNGTERIKFTGIPAGLKIMVRGVNARQQLFIYTSQPDSTQKKLEQVWQKKICFKKNL
ncbi:hypothetical protein KAR26_00485 [Candidatus Parcubacteria bacterium]|nr:hypothetical protein [Candidatus Parcubacteria bacterium]